MERFADGEGVRALRGPCDVPTLPGNTSKSAAAEISLFGSATWAYKQDYNTLQTQSNNVAAPRKHVATAALTTALL